MYTNNSDLTTPIKLPVAIKQITDYLKHDWIKYNDNLKVNNSKINKMFKDVDTNTLVYYGISSEATEPFVQLLEDNVLFWVDDADFIYEVPVGDPDDEEFNRAAFYDFGICCVIYVGCDCGDDSTEIYVYKK